MAKVLLTGGAGFIGSFVARELVAAGHEVVIFDSFVQYVSPLESCYKHSLRKRFEGIEDRVIIERGDVRDKLALVRILQQYAPTRIVHLAGLPLADMSSRYPDETVSSILNSTVNLLDIIKEMKSIERFLLISSSMVYGDFIYTPADEDHPKNPKEVYGGTKFAAEVLTRSYGTRFGVPFTIVRPSAVYGPTDVNNRVSQHFVMNAFLGRPLQLHNGGTATLDFTYVTDAAHGIFLALFSDHARNETFNITRGEGRSLEEFAGILRGYFPDLTVQYRESDVFRPRRGALDILKARARLGYTPEFSLETGIGEYVRFVAANLPEELRVPRVRERCEALRVASTAVTGVL